MLQTIRILLLVQLMISVSIRLHAQLPDFSRTDLPTHLTPTSLIAADLNKDELFDIVVSNTILYEEYLTVFLRDTTVGYVVRGDIPIPGDGVFSLSYGDFNEDGNLDLLVPCALSDNVFLYRGTGDGWFEEPEDLWAGADPQPVTVSDFNLDGHDDFVVSSWTTGYLNVMIGNGDGTFEGPVPYLTRGGPNQSCVRDFNEDGNPDIAVANSTYNDIALFLGEGDGSFITGNTFDVLYDAYTLSPGDFNEDGHLDLACGTHRSLSILHGDGTGEFVRVQDFVTVAHHKWVWVDDFNQDGYDDVSICIKDLSTIVILPGNGSGLFGEELMILPVGSTPQTLFVIENSYGHPDLLTACKDDDIVTVLRNQLDRELVLDQTETTVAKLWGNVFVNLNLSARNLTEQPMNCDIWFTISIGDSSEVLVPAEEIGWQDNPLPLDFAPLEQKNLPSTEIILPYTPLGKPVFRFRLGIYPEVLYSIDCLEIPMPLGPPSG